MLTSTKTVSLGVLTKSKHLNRLTRYEFVKKRTPQRREVGGWGAGFYYSILSSQKEEVSG